MKMTTIHTAITGNTASQILTEKQHSYSHHPTNRLFFSLHFTTHLFLLIHQTQSVLYCTKTVVHLNNTHNYTNSSPPHLTFCTSCLWIAVHSSYFLCQPFSFLLNCNLQSFYPPTKTFFFKCLFSPALQCLHTSLHTNLPTKPNLFLLAN